VQDARGNGSSLSGPQIELLTSEADSEQSRFHEDRFAGIKMYVERRAARARRQRTFEEEHRMPIVAADPPHPEDLAAVMIFHDQEAFR
jgi:hypothetical protein